mmetsp:Transcript_61165/g.179373  ORF Transcript_61165/g.179373 Transcript_61165/m.179373 type:complete len:237 (-) Transcript_61165:162-872(-)
MPPSPGPRALRSWMFECENRMSQLLRLLRLLRTSKPAIASRQEQPPKFSDSLSSCVRAPSPEPSDLTSLSVEYEKLSWHSLSIFRPAKASKPAISVRAAHFSKLSDRVSSRSMPPSPAASPLTSWIFDSEKSRLQPLRSFRLPRAAKPDTSGREGQKLSERVSSRSAPSRPDPMGARCWDTLDSAKDTSLLFRSQTLTPQARITLRTAWSELPPLSASAAARASARALSLRTGLPP